MTRLIIDPLTRVEGHGRVELLLAADGRLEDVRVRLLESPRLFEALLVGRHCDEVADLVCRICAICSAVHKLAALQAVEAALGVHIPPQARALRELLLLGGHLQSHALHLFCLILPDLRGVPDVLALVRQKDALAGAGLALKAFGNRIQEVAGGRVIHPVLPVLGGVAGRPETTALEELAAETELWRRDWPEISERFAQAGNYPEAGTALGCAVAAGEAGGFTLGGSRLWYGEAEQLSVDGYARLLDERSRPDSHAKDAAGEQGPFLSGALARHRLAAARGLVPGALPEGLGIHANNAAQALEIGWALARCSALLEELLASPAGEPLRAGKVEPGGGVGTAALEAPRGLLVHHYVIDEWGRVAGADVVTPTAINQRVMAAQIMADLAGERDAERMRSVAERIVRAYDPCISCAVHLLSVDAPAGDGRPGS